MRLRYAIPGFLLLFLLPLSLRAQTMVPGQTLYGTVNWTSSMNPIVVTGDITIADGATLTIGPGCDVRFQENSDDTHWGWDIIRSEIIVYGTLNISGTPSDLVILTSTGTGAQGWFGIIFSDNTAAGTIQYCNIDHSVYGINFTACDGPLYGGTAPVVSNCMINDVSVGMLFDDDSSPSITSSTIINAAIGFECMSSSAPAITGCNVAFLTGASKMAVYATEGAKPTFTGCAFASGSVDLDMNSDVVMRDSTIADTVSGIIGHETRNVGGSKILSACSMKVNNCNVIGLGDKGEGIVWDDNLNMLTVEYSRIGGFIKNVSPKWGSVDAEAGILHMIGPRFSSPYYGTCTGGDDVFLIDSNVNFYGIGAHVGMTVYNDTDGSSGTVVDIISIPPIPPTFNTLRTSGMSSGTNNPGDIYHFMPQTAYNNIDMGDLGAPDPYRSWPPGHVPSVGENEFYGVQDPSCLFNIEMETSSPTPPSLYQLEVWAEGNWWVTTNGTVINRYIWDHAENIYLGAVHYTPHRTPDEKRTYSISGTIEDAIGDAVAGVRVSVDISVQFPGHTVLAAITDEDGYYTIYGLLPSATPYSVVPQRLGYTFTPPSKTVIISALNPSDVTGQDFTTTLPAPVITSVSRKDGADGADYGLPGRTNWGIDSATTDIVVTGINFRQTPAIFLRGPLPSSSDTACSNISFVTATNLTATVPAGMAIGDYAVRVVNPDGQDDIWGDASTPGFTIVPPRPPQVFSISPNPIDNGYSGFLTVTGRNFIVGCGVTIDGYTWSALTPAGDGTGLLLSYTPGALGVGTWAVVVTNPGGQVSNHNVTLMVIGAVPTATPTPTPTPIPTPPPAAFPRLQLSTNASTYHLGDVLSLGVELWPGTTLMNNLVDPYIAVRIPTGSMYFLANGRWNSSAVPIFEGLFIGAHSSFGIGSFTLGPELPRGGYTFYGVLNKPGKSVLNGANWLSPLNSRSFTIE